MCYEWRYDKSIVTGLYEYLEKNYPFPIPKALFFSGSPSWLLKTIDNKRKDYYKIRKTGGLAIEEFQIEDFANKWLRDCLSGESFFERNKDLFTANNVNIFLKNSSQFQNDRSFCRLIKQYYSSKIYPVQNSYLNNILADKFKYCFNHPHVINFLTFIHNNKNIPGLNIIRDICDYFKAEIIKSNRQIYSFKGRTWHSLKRICNEWHRAMQMPQKLKENNINKHWNKFPFINKNVINDKGKTWKFTQITTGKLLYEEGEYMHHCCFTYIDQCINGDCAIFSLRCYEKEKIIDEKSATLEITNDNFLIQARGQFNNELDKETMEIIYRWREENGIKIRQFYFDEAYENEEYDEYYEEDDDYYEREKALDFYYENMGDHNDYDNYDENDDETEEN